MSQRRADRADQRRSAAAARNEGLRHAVGRWLMFVDSDDLLLPGAIRTLLEAAQRLDADVVQGGWQYLYTDGTRGPVQRYPAAVYTGAAAPERFERDSDLGMQTA